MNEFVVPIAQSLTGVSLGSTLTLATLAGLLGIALGYGLGYRFKRQYLVAARQLANLRGENFRGELTTIALGPTAAAKAAKSDSEDAELARLHREIAEKDQRIGQLEAQLRELHNAVDHAQDQLEGLRQQTADQPASAPATAPPASIPAHDWQIQQLHREQVAMQMKLDDYASQVAELTAELQRRQ